MYVIGLRNYQYLVKVEIFFVNVTNPPYLGTQLKSKHDRLQ